MATGYYWAKRNGKWVVVEVVDRLYDAVLERGRSVQRSEYSQFIKLEEPA